MPPAATMAVSAITHSGRFSEWIATTSPGRIPIASSPFATTSTASQYCAQLISRQIPSTFSRKATPSGLVRACSSTRVAGVIVRVVPGRGIVVVMLFLLGSAR